MAIAQTATLDVGTEPKDMDALDSDERRAVRARTENMVIVPQADADGTCIGMYDVYSQSGEHYVVLDHEQGCNCEDTKFNHAENCKHRRRVALEITEAGCPAPGQQVGDYAGKLADVRAELESQREAMRDDLEIIERMIEPLDR